MNVSILVKYCRNENLHFVQKKKNKNTKPTFKSTLTVKSLKLSFKL